MMPQRDAMVLIETLAGTLEHRTAAELLAKIDADPRAVQLRAVLAEQGARDVLRFSPQRPSTPFRDASR
jgi:hypothetical protein